MRRTTVLAKTLWVSLLLCGVFSCSMAQAQLSKLFAPGPKGSLIIVGGGDTPDSVQNRFINLAGGAGKARIAILPMASQKTDEEAQEVKADFQRLGTEAQVISMDQREANSESIAKDLEQFSGYWFTGEINPAWPICWLEQRRWTRLIDAIVRVW